MIETMEVRDYSQADLSDLEHLFQVNGFDYRFPRMDAEDILSCMVVADEHVRMAAIQRLEVNCMLLIDHKWRTPSERWQYLQALHELARQKAEEAGIQEANSWIPPSVEKKFATRLEFLGWRKNLWPNYARKVKES